MVAAALAESSSARKPSIRSDSSARPHGAIPRHSSPGGGAASAGPGRRRRAHRRAPADAGTSPDLALVAREAVAAYLQDAAAAGRGTTLTEPAWPDDDECR